MRKGAGVLFMLLAGYLSYGAGARELESPPIRDSLDLNKTFTIALLESPEELHLDPFEATDATSLLILNGLFEGLYTHDPQTGEPVAALTERTQVSEDGLRWVFTIREDARFSNGEPITAHIFVDSWRHLLQQAREGEASGYLSSLMENIVGVREFREGKASADAVGVVALDDQRLSITLKNRTPYLPALLCMPALSAVHPTVREDTSTKFVTSGPYQISKRTDDQIILEKQPWYYDYDAVVSDFIQISYLSEKALIDAYQDRKVHWTPSYIPLDSLHNKEDLHIYPEFSTSFYYFSASDGPYADPKVRKALGLLIPWDELREASGQVFPTAHLIPNYQRSFTSHEHDQQQALQESYTLLSEAGYPYGSGLPPLSLAIHRGSQVQHLSERIADMLSRSLGITVIVDTVPLSMYTRYPHLSPYDAAFMTWIGDFLDPIAFLHLFSSTGYNVTNTQDKTFDELLRKTMESPEERERYITEAEQHLLSSYSVFPMYHGITTHVILSDTVIGWYDNVLNIHPLKHLGIR